MEIPTDSKPNLPKEEVKPVKDSLLGLTALNQDIVLLNHGHVIIRRGYKNLKIVRLLSGGAAGTDLCHAVLVGKGMLTAAILGDEAGPTSRQILRIIRELNEGENCGIFVISQANSELFNFSLAVERARVDCKTRVGLLSIDDYRGPTRERNSCGFIMLIKILGAMADRGAFYDDISQCYKNIVELIVSVPLNYVDEETGPQRRKSLRLSNDFETSIHHVIDEKSQSTVGFHPSIPTVALINTPKKLDRMAELELVKQVIDRLKQLGVCVVRVYLGNFVSTTHECGSITFMKVFDNKIIDYLDAPCEAPGWHSVVQFLPRVTVDNEMPGLLTNHGKQRIPLKGPRLSEEQSGVLVKSVQFACDALISCERQLNIIDAENSVGNVGTRFKTMAQHVNKRLNDRKLPILCPYAFMKKLSIVMESAIGGTMGSIYGILFESAANVFGDAPDEESIAAVTWANALTAAVTAIENTCSEEMKRITMFYPIKMCDGAINQELKKGSHFLECYGLGVSVAEEAAQKTRQSFHKYADAGAHAVGIWMRAVFEGVKLFCINNGNNEKLQ